MFPRKLTTLAAFVSVLGFALSAANAQTVVYVDDDASLGGNGTSWETAYKYLQDALMGAADGTEIRVAQGTYKPDRDEAGNVTPGARTETFQLITGVGLYGGYRGCPGGDCSGGNSDERDIDLYETILSGDLLGNDGPDFENYDENSYHVVTGISVNETAVLDGFTMIGGYPHYTTCGGGLYNNAASPTINNCLFTANLVALCNDEGSNPDVTNCKFIGNGGGSGGGIRNLSSSPLVTKCVFRDNSVYWDGGGMRNYDHSNPTVTDCTFNGNSANTGGGMSNHEQSRPTVTRCMFLNNSALGSAIGEGGAVLIMEAGNDVLGPVVFTSCLFVGNTAESGGGMVCGSSSVTLNSCIFTGNRAVTVHQPGQVGALAVSSWSVDSVVTLTNCTIVGNTASGWLGGVYADSWTDLAVTNCILWGNSSGDGSGMSDQVSGASSLDYSCIQGWSDGDGGTGNTGVDQLFVDSGGLDDIPGTEDDNLRLLPGSPAINAGEPTYVPEPGETDLDGHARVLCARVDMGAYEFGIGDYDCDQVVDLPDFANWGSCFTGPAEGPYPEGCEVFDFDYDGDVDLRDLGGFQAAFAGSGG